MSRYSTIMADPIRAEIYKKKKHDIWLKQKNEDRLLAKRLNAEAARNYRKNQKELRKLSNSKSSEHSIKLRIRKLRAYRRNKIVIDSFKNNGCIICKESDTCCLDAHHVNPKTKSFGISQATGTVQSIKAVIKELSKCVCLCKNCHAKVHDLKINLPKDCLKQTSRWQSGLQAMSLGDVCT